LIEYGAYSIAAIVGVRLFCWISHSASMASRTGCDHGRTRQMRRRAEILNTHR
jgi:hypothetical protein